MSDLFDKMPESLSPREEWVREHGVRTRERNLSQEGYADDWPREIEACALSQSVTAPTRDEALAKLAQRLWTHHGVKPWNYDR